MDELRLNKLFAAFLFAALLLMAGIKIADVMVPHQKLAQNSYVIEVAETTAKIAEMTKLTENSFRDVNIAFANELSMIASNQNVDIWELIELANRHPRVNILKPGPGVGGHCVAVDPWFLVNADKENTKLAS